MSQDHKQYTQDFLKGQELPEIRRDYLVGNLPLAGKYNPQGVKKLMLATSVLTPLALISAGLAYLSQTLRQTVLFGGIFLLCLWGIYRTMKKIRQH